MSDYKLTLQSHNSNLQELINMANELPDKIEGVQLNFEIVGGLEQPTNPTENMIWVQTDVAISGWKFSSSEPENAVEGLVWIYTGSSSEVGFDIVENVAVYPIYAKQYVNGAWVDKDAQIYQGGAWGKLVVILPVEESLWTTSRADYGVISTSYHDGVFTCNSSNGGRSAGTGETNLIYTPLIDCAPYKTLTLLGSCTMATQYNCPQTVYLKDGSTTVLSKSLANFTDRFELDVTNISKKCTLSVYANHGMDSSHTLKLTGIELK